MFIDKQLDGLKGRNCLLKADRPFVLIDRDCIDCACACIHAGEDVETGVYVYSQQGRRIRGLSVQNQLRQERTRNICA